MLRTDKQTRFPRTAYRRRLQSLISDAYRFRDLYADYEARAETLEQRWRFEERHAGFDLIIHDLEAVMQHVWRMP